MLKHTHAEYMNSTLTTYQNVKSCKLRSPCSYEIWRHNFFSKSMKMMPTKFKFFSLLNVLFNNSISPQMHTYDQHQIQSTKRGEEFCGCLCVSVIFLHHFIYNMIIFYSRFAVAFSPRICVFECVCVCVCVCLSSMKNRFKFLQRISFLFHVSATVHAIFFLSLASKAYTYNENLQQQTRKEEIQK